MRRKMFAKHIVVADAQPRWLVLVFQVLWRIADDTAGVKTVARTDRGQPREIYLWPNDTIRAQLDALIDHGVWPDPDRRIQLRPGVNDGRWMNHKFKVADSARLPSSKMPPGRRGFVPVPLHGKFDGWK